MKRSFRLLFLFVLLACSAFSQFPNRAKRGQTLVTTVTSFGGNLTISSGMGSSYSIYMTLANYQLNAASYVMHAHVPYLGFADSVTATFNIPQYAPPGSYTMHVRAQWDNFDRLSGSIFVEETLLKGSVYFDANQNGLRDSLEYGMPYQSVLISPLGTILQTDFNGNYQGQLAVGTFTDSLLVPPNFTVTSGSNSYSITLPPDDTTGNDFGLFTPPDTTLNHQIIATTNPPRCFRNFNSYWHASSLSNNTQSGSVTVIFDSTQSFYTSQPTPDYISGDTLRWNYSLQPFQTLEGIMTFIGGAANSMSGFVVIDSLNGTNGNVIVQIDTVSELTRCSFDPNDKRVEPEGIDSLFHYTDINATLKYFIRFQNCGTDTAFSIEVRDSIDSDLDITTLQILYASSPVRVQVEPYRIIRFFFDNIMLPDSNVDEVNSHGTIIFSIAPKSNVLNNSVIKNKAYIYFDLNAPVITNETMNTLVQTLPNRIETVGRENNLLVYPNPLTATSIIQPIRNSSYTLSIFDDAGRLILQRTIKGEYKIGELQLSRGIYFYRLIEQEGEEVFAGKVIVAE